MNISCVRMLHDTSCVRMLHDTSELFLVLASEHLGAKLPTLVNFMANWRKRSTS